MLAQTLLEEPKMSNHARGLWGYWGKTPLGRELTVQATGMGGPSAALVLADLAELGLRRAVRVGTCTALGSQLRGGELLAIAEAHAWGGPGERVGEAVLPDPELARRLQRELGGAGRTAVVASLDSLHAGGDAAPVAGGDAADMQTAALFGRGAALGVAIAAVLIVTETSAAEQLAEDETEAAARRAGAVASAVLST
jgi:uridine phosphorylase